MPCTVLLCECIWIVLEQNSIFLHIVWSWVSNMFNSFSFHYFTCCTNVLESMECKRLNGILKCTHTKSKLLFLELQWLPWLHKKQRQERSGMRLIYSQLIYMVAFIWCCFSSSSWIHIVLWQYAISLVLCPLIIVQISRCELMFLACPFLQLSLSTHIMLLLKCIERGLNKLRAYSMVEIHCDIANLYFSLFN